MIKDLFAKPIDRDMKGVIKVGQDDSANRKQELEEYVVTRELQKHFAEFFTSYKRGITGNTDKMGVWISGFFGSGKSHFLKILSYLLSSKAVDGKTAIDYFVEDRKIADSAVLADMALAASVPTDVVLFNIDSKSEMNGKQDKDAIVSVFLKVFNEMQGFCGSNPALADLERKLTEEGRYEAFKAAYEASSGSLWTEDRSEFDFISGEVAEVLVKIGFMSEGAAQSWCDKALEPYSISIERFADMVRRYVEKKGGNHHVVFLVDEIGQYIGDDSRLMLNLQTVTEDLGTACQGKAWIIVTSQQDIDSITRIKGSDFSKIQGRFDTRLSLSSANVDEVIRKRILDKNEAGRQALGLLYDEKSIAIKNLILFNDSAEKKLYRDREDFSAVYPFIPYQFNLLGSVLTSIREHGASGKHLAEGERSMLALFKESAVRIMDQTPGALVPFHLFYDALEQFLDHSHKGVISRALDNGSLNPEHAPESFDVNVLKTLFMIKYVKEITANAHNVASLMATGIDDDRMELERRVEDALKRLVRQTLVQKNGEVYVFLTDEEQEINRVIESQEIENAEVIRRISEMIFDGIYDEKKYRCEVLKGRYQFGFNRLVDDRPYKSNQNYDLSLHVLTPDNDDPADGDTLRMRSGQEGSVLVALPGDRTFLDEITSALKIERFIRLDSASAMTRFEQIKETKTREMRERSAAARLFLEEALKEAAIYAGGDRLQSSAREVSSRLNEAIGILVAKTYHKLSYIDTAMGEEDIRCLLKDQNQQLSLGSGVAAPNTLALQEMVAYVNDNRRRSLKALLDRFTRKPYGFLEIDVEWLAAKLFKDGEIAFFINNESITLLTKTADEITRCLTRREYAEKLMIEKRVRAGEKQKKAVREVMRELFHATPASEDDDALMDGFMKRAKDLKTDLEKLEVRYNGQPQYPGKAVVRSGRQLMERILPIQYPGEFFAEVDGKRDELLDFAEDYEPIQKFFAGEQLEIFDRALRLMQIYEDSKTFIVHPEIESIVGQINEVIKKPAPYGEIHKLPLLLDQYVKAYGGLLREMGKPILDAIDQAKERVFAELDGKACRERLSERFIQKFEALRSKATSCNNVARLQNIRMEADALKVRCLNEISAAEEELAAKRPPDEAGAAPVKIRRQKTVSIRTLTNVGTWQLETGDDVRRYVADLEEKLLSALEDDTVINVEF